MADDRYLPGCPSKKVVKEVRRAMSHWGIRVVDERRWRLTWTWAAQVKNSYFHPRWPMPSEIVSQYVFLLLMDMKSLCQLRLPYRAAEQMPPPVQQMIALQGNPLAIGDRHESARHPVPEVPRLTGPAVQELFGQEQGDMPPARGHESP